MLYALGVFHAPAFAADKKSSRKIRYRKISREYKLYTFTVNILFFKERKLKTAMKSRHKLNRMELREERAAYGFLFLSLIGTTVFILVPILMSMFLGFTAWNPMKGLAGVEFTGLENFQNILKDDRVLSAIRNNRRCEIFSVNSDLL